MLKTALSCAYVCFRLSSLSVSCVSFHINAESHMEQQGSQDCGKSRRRCSWWRPWGQPLASSDTVLSHKGTSAFVLKGEPLGLGDLCHVIGLERPWREAGTYKHFCALTWVSWLTLMGNSTHKSTDYRLHSLSLSYLTPLWLPSKTGNPQFPHLCWGEETPEVHNKLWSAEYKRGGWQLWFWTRVSQKLILSLTLPKLGNFGHVT